MKKLITLFFLSPLVYFQISSQPNPSFANINTANFYHYPADNNTPDLFKLAYGIFANNSTPQTINKYYDRTELATVNNAKYSSTENSLFIFGSKAQTETGYDLEIVCAKLNPATGEVQDLLNLDVFLEPSASFNQSSMAVNYSNSTCYIYSRIGKKLISSNFNSQTVNLIKDYSDEEIQRLELLGMDSSSNKIITLNTNFNAAFINDFYWSLDYLDPLTGELSNSMSLPLVPVHFQNADSYFSANATFDPNNRIVYLTSTEAEIDVFERIYNVATGVYKVDLNTNIVTLLKTYVMDLGNDPSLQIKELVYNPDNDNLLALAHESSFTDGASGILVINPSNGLVETGTTVIPDNNSLNLNTFLTFDVLTNDFLSIPDKSSNLGVTIFPSPASHTLNISSKIKIKELSVLNNVGQVILHQTINNKNKYELNVSKLSSGSYFLKLKGENNIETRKLIINN